MPIASSLFRARAGLRLLVALLALLGLSALPATAAAVPSSDASIAPLRVSSHSPCQLSSADGVASFDLRRLRHAAGYLAQTRPSAPGADDAYAYYFNICANVSAPWERCGTEASGPAFQVQPAQPDLLNRSAATSCTRLGSDALAAEWRLLDARDPSRGVTLRYGGGDECAGGKQRQFVVHFLCADDADLPGDTIDATVDEGKGTARCEYEVEFVTFYACPTQCPAYGKLMCNGGWCGMDHTLGRPRCFCREGSYGADCSSSTPESASSSRCNGLCILLAVCLAFLSLFLVVAGLVYWKVSRILDKQQSVGLSQGARGSGVTKRGGGGEDATGLQLDLAELEEEPDGPSALDSGVQRQVEDELEMELGLQLPRAQRVSEAQMEQFEADLAEEEDLRAL